MHILQHRQKSALTKGELMICNPVTAVHLYLPMWGQIVGIHKMAFFLLGLNCLPLWGFRYWEGMSDMGFSNSDIFHKSRCNWYNKLGHHAKSDFFDTRYKIGCHTAYNAANYTKF